MPRGRIPRDPYEIIDYDEIIDDSGVEKRPVRLIDRVEDTLRANGFLHDAASRVGMDRDTLRRWREKGVKAKVDLLAGRKRRSDLDRHTKRCIELAERMERAEAEARLSLISTVTRLAEGGLMASRVVEKRDHKGNITERVVETKEMLPDSRALTWLLSRRYPADFAGRVEITGEGGGPVEVEVSVRDRLIAAVAHVRERSVIDVPSNGELTEAGDDA